MDYTEALKFIHSRGKFGSYQGLMRMKELMSMLGDPQNNLKFVHVAGTNGKGSTVKLISAALIETGYKTGTYISPFVEVFNERIQINFQNISDSDLADVITRVRNAVEELDSREAYPPVTEFECITAAAFCCYCEKDCDIVVLETGLGGRLDATNIIDTPIVSVITPISFDHTEVLGDTIGKIAAEKCGIIKQNSHVVISPSQHSDAVVCIENACAETNSKLYQLCEENAHNIKLRKNGSSFEYEGLNINLNLAGRYQISNALTALQTLFVLRNEGFDIPDAVIQKAFSNCSFFGRLCHLSDNIILDGAHNPNGFDALCDYIDSFVDGRLICVVGMLKDKDYEDCIRKIASYADMYIAMQPDSPRALSAGENMEEAKKYCSEVYGYSDMRKGIDHLNNIITADDTVIVCGSLYMLKDVKELIERYVL